MPDRSVSSALSPRPVAIRHHVAAARRISKIRTLPPVARGGRRSSVARVAVFLMLLCGTVTAEERRDPTQPHTNAPRTSSVAGAPRITINAIFVSDDRRLAIVNGERVRIGDTVSGAKVVDIRKEQVTLSVSGRQFIARLKTRGSQ